MQLYDMSEECEEEVRNELDLRNKDGIFSRILKEFDEKFEYYDHFSLNPDELNILAENLRYFKQGNFVSAIHKEVEGVGKVIIFDFYTDICNVYELIRDSIYSKWYQQPFLIISKDRIADRLKYLVNQYLIRKEGEE